MAKHLQKLSIFVVPLVILLGAGCATTQSEIPAELRVSIRRLSVAPEIPVPEGFIFQRSESKLESERDTAGVIAAVLGPLLRSRPIDWDRNADIREHVSPATLIPEVLLESFTQELALNSDGYVLVDEDAIPPPDAVFVFQVLEMDWADTIFCPFTAHSKPLLRISAMLVAHPPFILVPESDQTDSLLVPEDRQANPICWHLSRGYCRTHRHQLAPAWHMNTYVKKPDLLRKSLTAICRVAGRNMALNFLRTFPQHQNARR